MHSLLRRLQSTRFRLQDLHKPDLPQGQAQQACRRPQIPCPPSACAGFPAMPSSSGVSHLYSRPQNSWGHPTTGETAPRRRLLGTGCLAKHSTGFLVLPGEPVHTFSYPLVPTSPPRVPFCSLPRHGYAVIPSISHRLFGESRNIMHTCVGTVSSWFVERCVA